MQCAISTRRAFTLIELLVALGILIVLAGLILPAIQRVREAANRLVCSSHLRHLGTALAQHHAERRGYPTNGGWDGQQKIKDTAGNWIVVSTWEASIKKALPWGVGEPLRNTPDQPGSWAFAVLPYLEHNTVYRDRSWTTALDGLVCPTRRRAEALPAVDDQYGKYAGGGWAWGRTDYAANGLAVPNRPKFLRQGDFNDGLANTILLGEKALDPDVARTGSWFWDEPFFLGGSGGTQRIGDKVLRDAPGLGTSVRFQWGSAHPDGARFLFADNSVRTLRFDIDPKVLAALLSPAGGERVTVPD